MRGSIAWMALRIIAPPWFFSATTGAPHLRAVSTTRRAQTSGDPWMDASSSTHACRL